MRYALGLAAAVMALAGCTSSPGSSNSSAAATSTTPAANPASDPAVTATVLTCGTAPKALVDQASQSIAAHPGAVTATAYVFAATTDTGDWYVLGLDRDYVHDDGSPAGGASRSLALTNLSRPGTNGVAMIPLTVGLSERTPISWNRVSWTGDTLAAGQRAAKRAVECLETAPG
ncbi:hypothetical protein FHX52_2679 [Humibacillus xanthopallidus]|uniref:Lipoprotein n=2 Tax=Humibacillus xanthopallidus TaxID=412689 RepID=A0A543PPH7_9MICO|nr:hypothetical protein [Humibacillus xanthopallidus]TQN45974.1 hypothetical protein FHX52_2679 [Humibacillus xanthopallidus]